MPRIKISKKEAEGEIEDFFLNIKHKTPKQIKKIKRLASNKKIPLKEKRKLFCKKCFNPYSGNEKTRIKKGMKSVVCLNCKHLSKWRIKKPNS